MVIVRVVWGGDRAECYLRDPVRRGNFVCGVMCNEYGVAVRTEGCTEDAEMRIRADRIVSYEEAVL